MDCKRLERLIKSWYIQVQDEAMAPARMVSFMEQHIAECFTCLADSVVRQEVAKITELVLPASKITKTETTETSQAHEDETATDDESTEDDDESTEDEDEDDDDDVDEDEDEDD